MDDFFRHNFFMNKDPITKPPKFEIERKFLVNSDYLNDLQIIQIRDIKQGYISLDPLRTVRVRVSSWDNIIDETGTAITVKGAPFGITRNEWETAISGDDALEMLKNLCDNVLHKQRRTLSYMGNIWEVDEFFGDNTGLVVAEIELDREDQQFEKPSWIGEEVTNDPRYYNSALIQNPYKNWCPPCPDVVEQRLIESLKKLAELQHQAELEYQKNCDDFWHDLSPEHKLKAFYSVVKRIVQGELQDHTSYRGVLYEVFGFGAESYAVGMMCGFMDLHNSIYTSQDIDRLKKEWGNE